MSKADAPIGIFDSGIGGLTVLNALRKSLPKENFVYLGDTARYPYGPKSATTIIRYARECADFLLEKKVKLIIVACNTASALAIESLRVSLEVPVIGTIEQATRNAILATHDKKIGVIGTEATIRSAVYENAIKDIDTGIKVESRACPLFVPLVEQGLFAGEIVEKVIDYHLASLRRAHIDTLLLGCTHYPMLSEALHAYWNHQISIVECSTSIAEHVKSALGACSLLNHSSKGIVEYFVTDDSERFDRLTRVFLNEASIQSKQIELKAVELPPGPVTLSVAHS